MLACLLAADIVLATVAGEVSPLLGALWSAAVVCLGVRIWWTRDG
jgi:hypothetical protein